MATPFKRIELGLLSSLPAAIAAGLAFFFLSAKHITGLGHFMPLLPLIAVFYWGMSLAREMPYWFVFLLGLVMDAVAGLPLGLSSLMYVLFLLMLHRQHKHIHKEGFVIKWGYFATLLGVTAAINWIILSLFHSRFEPFIPAFIQWILTICCYPGLHKIFDMVHEYILARRWRILHRH